MLVQRIPSRSKRHEVRPYFKEALSVLIKATESLYLRLEIWQRDVVVVSCHVHTDHAERADCLRVGKNVVVVL